MIYKLGYSIGNLSLEEVDRVIHGEYSHEYHLYIYIKGEGEAYEQKCDSWTCPDGLCADG